MKLATPNRDKCQVPSGMKKGAAQSGLSCHVSRVACHVSAFTLAEVLAAMLFLAIVIPVAVEALHVSSLAGEVAARKGVAARIADRVINENLVTTNWTGGGQSGTISEGVLDFKWTLTTQTWPQGPSQTLTPQSGQPVPMQMLSVKVDFPAQGRDYSVTLNTLTSYPNQVGTTTMSMR